jgi:hypothetical protein
MLRIKAQKRAEKHRRFLFVAEQVGYSLIDTQKADVSFVCYAGNSKF